MGVFGHLLRGSFVAGLVLTSATALAQGTATHSSVGSIYTCKDPNGRTITSDRPIPECAKLPMRELRSDGALRRQIDPPLTRAQRRMLREKRARERAEELVRRQERTRDRALLETFPTMDILDESRERLIAEIQLQIDATYERMVKLHKELQAAQAAGRAYPPGLAPTAVKQKVAQIAGAILTEDSLVKARLEEQEQIRQKYAADADRLRVLLERQAEADRLAG
ncbi:MAG: hypothetical protein AB8C46_00870 [Burkholderiaceae bacterium]